LFDHLRKKIQVIHAHSTYPSGYAAVLFAKIFNVPTVIALDGEEAVFLEDIQFGHLGNKWRKGKNEFVISKASVITALTQFQASGILHQYQRMSEIIIRGIDRGKLFEPRRTFPNQYTTFLNVGYLHPVKDPMMLIDAFAKIAEKLPCKLIQVGKDYMNGDVQALARRLKVDNRIEFKGLVPHDEMASIYEKADVLLHSSLFESQAMVMNEAMTHGLLVLGTRVGLFADLDGYCCKTVLPGDANALASLVVTTLQDTEECSRLLRNAEKWCAEHNLDFTTGKYLHLYDRLLNG
ncbi:MAG: glycosyltransferase, partial [Flammeovirgaceae bacterium]